ncbi:MAG: hypothetical protein NXI20_24810 [bacterium]|nr:hypothetical protein [bacterium]
MNWKIAFIILALPILGNSPPRNKIRGEYQSKFWDGRHGHYVKINIKSRKFKKVSWSSNFFYPTEKTITGKILANDSFVTAVPEKISFYLNDKKNNQHQKLKCKCNSLTISKMALDTQSEILEMCASMEFLVSGDTLIQKETEEKFYRISSG